MTQDPEPTFDRKRHSVFEEIVSGPWYCVKCGLERPPDPRNVCPRPGCGMRAYGSRRPENPVLPQPAEDDRQQ